MHWDDQSKKKRSKNMNIPDEQVIRGMKDKEVDLIEGTYTEEDLKIDLSDLYSQNTLYSPEQKIAAAQAYLITGTSVQAQKYCGVKADIIRDWKNKSTWWPELFKTVQKQKSTELEANFTRILDTSLVQLEDRLENGDTKIQKDGSLTRVPMGGKEIAVVLAIMYDKRALLRGDVTSRVEKKDGNSMKILQDKFEDIARQLEAKTINNTYEVLEDNERITGGNENG